MTNCLDNPKYKHARDIISIVLREGKWISFSEIESKSRNGNSELRPTGIAVEEYLEELVQKKEIKYDNLTDSYKRIF